MSTVQPNRVTTSTTASLTATRVAWRPGPRTPVRRVDRSPQQRSTNATLGSFPLQLCRGDIRFEPATPATIRAIAEAETHASSAPRAKAQVSDLGLQHLLAGGRSRP